MQSRSPLSTEIDAILQHRWFYYSITIPKLQEKCLQIDSASRFAFFIICCLFPFGCRGQAPSLQHQWVRGRRGEHCSPVQLGGSARFCERAMLAPTATAKPPLCKGRWHGVSRDGGIGACTGVLRCIRKVTIPQSALSRSQLPLHKGAFSLRP